MNSRVRLIRQPSIHLALTMLTVPAIPKKYTIFRFEIPQPVSTQSTMGDEAPEEKTKAERALVFELHGSQFENRAPDRATKKFKQRNMNDL